MSRSIDERIVEMRFDNKQFENGIKESLSSLLKLDEVLKRNISAKSLEDISKAANNINVSGLNKAIESINSRFSTLGIAAARVIENLVDGLTNGLGNAIRTTTDSIVSGGVKRAMNIENAHFQLQGLISDEKEVQAIMQQANDSVDGTAYSYDVAAKAASMFAATGIKSGRQMEIALKGIAGVAATTNADYERVSQIFTTISGQGRVMADQLNQFASMGMNAAAALTTYMNKVNDGTAEASDEVKAYIQEITGGVQITEAELRDMVSNSLISFDLFSEAMGRSFGDHAKDANRTFTGAMANIRAALARTGAMFVSPLISQDGEFVQFFNAVRIKVNEFNKALGASNGLAKEFTDWVIGIVKNLTSIVENFKIANIYVQKFGDGTEKTIESAHKSIQKFGDGTEKIVNKDMYTPFHALVDVVHTVVNVLEGLYSIVKRIGLGIGIGFFNWDESITDVYKLIESIRILSENFKLSHAMADHLTGAFLALFANIRSVVDIIVKLCIRTSEYLKGSDSVILNLLILGYQINEIIMAMIFYAEQSGIVNKAVDYLAKGIANAVNLIAKALMFIFEVITDVSFTIERSETSRKHFENTLSNIVKIFKNLVGIGVGIVNFFNNLFHITDENITVEDRLSDVLIKLINIILVLADNITSVIAAITTWLNTSSKVENTIYAIVDKLKTFKQTVENAIPQPVQDAFNKFVKSIERLSILSFKDITLSIKGLAAAIKDIIAGRVELEDIGTHLVNGLTIGIRLGISNVIKAATELASALLHTIMDYLGIHSPSTEGIAIGENFIQGIVNGLKAGFDKIKGTAAGLVKSLLDGSTNGFELFKENISGLISLIGGGSLIFLLIQMGKAFKNISEALGLLFGKTGGALSTMANSLSSTLGSVKDMANAYTKDLKADAFMKTAIGVSIGIGVITAALIALSKQSPDTLLAASASLSLVAYVFGETVERLMRVSSETSTVESALNTAAKGLSKSLKNLGKAVKIKAVGMAVKDFATAIGIIIADIAAVYLLYKHDEEGFLNAVGIVATIAAGIMLMIGIMSALGEKFNKGMTAFAKVGVGVLALAFAVSLTVNALKDVLALDFSWERDYNKIILLASLFGLISVLALAIGGASAIAGEGSIKTGPLLAMCAMIATSVWALKSIMDMELKDDWLTKLGILAGLYGALGLLMIAIGVAAKIAGGTIKAGGTILAMCFFIATSVAAIAILSVFPAEALKKGVLSLGGILISLAVVLLAASKITSASAGAVVLGMALMVAVIVAALSFLSFISWSKLWPGALSLGIVLLAVALVFNAVSKITNENIWKTVAGMVGILIAVVGGLYILSKVESWDTLLAAAISMSAVLLAVGKSFAILNDSKKPSIGHIVEYILGILGVVAIAYTLRTMTNIPWETLLAAGASISAVLLAIAKSFDIINSTETIKVDKMIAFIVGTIAAAIIGFVLSKVANVSWESLLGMAASIAIVLLAMAKSFDIINSTETIKADKIIAFIVGTIAAAIIGLILSQVASTPWESLLGMAASIGLVLLSMAEAFNAINSTETIGIDKIIAFIVGTIAAAVIGLILTQVANTPWDSLLGMAASIGLVLIAIAATFAIMDKINVSMKAIGAFAAGCIGVVLIGGIISEVAKYPWQQLLAAGVAISVVVLSMSVAMLLCTLAGDMAPAALAGIGLLDLFIGDLYAVLYLLNKYGDLDVIKDGGQKLMAIGKTLGDFAGSIIEGIGEGIGSALENIGISLSKFMINATPFFMGLKMIDDDTVKAAGALASVVIALAVAEFINGITNLFSVFMGTNDMPTFGEKLVAFGKSVALFDQATRNVDGDNVSKVAQAAKSLIDIAKEIPNSGGLLGKVMGNNDIDVFGQKLAAFGPSIAIFDMTTRAITDTSHWKQIADGMKYLTDMAAYIPNSGGLAGAVMGDNDIDVFGQKLKAFAPSILAFHNQVQSISDVSSWKRVADGTSYLVDMAKLIPNAGGLAGLIAGDNDIAEFGKSVLKFGIYLEEFNNHVNAIPMIMFSNISSGMMKLIAMCKSLKDVDPDVMVNFSDNMAKMAKDGLTSFISTFQTQTVVAINTVRSTISQIKNIAQNDTTVQAAFYNLANRNLTMYMKAITDKTPDVLSSLKTLLGKIISAIKSKDSDYKNNGVNHAKLYIAAIDSYKNNAYNSGVNLVKMVILGIMSQADELATYSERLAKKFSSAIEAQDNEVYNAAMELTNVAVRVFNDRNDTFEECGENAAKGFANGIKNKVDEVAEEARKLAEEAKAAIEDELDINSPSRVLRQDGQYAGEGFVLGLLDKIREVRNAALRVGQSSVDAFGEAIADISDITENLDPVITPIVDLSDVMKAADSINDLFSKAVTNVNSNVTSASNSMNRKNTTNGLQNIQNDDGSGNTNVTFIQNNNSPKALSRIDIYRQTRNQLAQFREAVERT